jgi:catechol 2,3-dioxygenase-like lactoylglutathione lyase family enzyme
MTVKRMDNVGIVVEDIDAAVAFFIELGLELEGRAPVEGDWADGVTGLRHMRVEIAMMRTPDGHSRLEISRFLAPPVVADHRSAPVNSLGYLRVMFTVEDLDDTLARLGKRARNSWADWSSTKMSIGSATSGAPKGFSSGWPNSSGSRMPGRIPWTVSVSTEAALLRESGG